MFQWWHFQNDHAWSRGELLIVEVSHCRYIGQRYFRCGVRLECGITGRELLRERNVERFRPEREVSDRNRRYHTGPQQ